MSDGHRQLPIHEIISQVMSSVRSVAKAQRNRDQGFDFRGIDDVVNAVGPKFREFGVVPAPLLESAAYRDVRTSKDKPARECTVQVRYRFWGPAGDYVDTVVPGEALDMGDKGTAKAMSVAYRIALLQLLTLPTDDRDPDAESYERAEPAAQGDQAAQVRGEIAALAKEKGYGLETIESDFRRVMNGADIRAADVAELAEYKQRLLDYKASEERA
ncbi:ERF family protein [Saccharopolyspora spinosa]|uniref:ERF superfamily protein n=1 Tax=Saccharopolyspora spinosa TaxID=60894 RepID=A0A2N3XZ73_SACSN|nr:ERF family protein [Saccharopolyspora spinosa]PKW15958.1 ERF superfamily protein [Saccharopolyspora spinosa]